MRTKSEISIVIKTFLRPECLQNILASIHGYQIARSYCFYEIIIIDDSDEVHQKINQKVVNSFQQININYQQYAFNSLGTSKGRNKGIELVSTPYFLLCDDDFILDEKCDIQACLILLQSKDVDILGGYYRDIKSVEDATYSITNWLGVITENDSFDICLIFTDLVPDFCYCDIVQTFFLAKTVAFKKVMYPEDMPQLEHNIFFLQAKQKRLRVASTNQLWTKHLHLRNKDYTPLRHRKDIVNPLNKPVLGYLITRDNIYHFKDYLHVAGEQYAKVDKKRSKYTVEINLFLFKATIYFSILKNGSGFLKKVKKTVSDKINFLRNKKRLQRIEKEYPKVLSTSETLEKIIQRNLSLARFGDGELKLILGEGLGVAGSPGEYQVYDGELAQRLKEILENPSENCLIAINQFKDPCNDEKNYKDGLSYWEHFWLQYWEKLRTCYSKTYYYSCAAVTRISAFQENDISTVKKLWENRKILFVVGEESHFVEVDILFDNTVQKEFLITRGRSAFADYNKIFSKILEYDRDWLIFLSLGPTATVLAYDLAQKGYQALDGGHLPNSYLQAIGQRESPEKEHWKGKQYKKERNI